MTRTGCTRDDVWRGGEWRRVSNNGFGDGYGANGWKEGGKVSIYVHYRV